MSSINISVTLVCAVKFKHDLPTYQSDFIVSVYGKAFWQSKILEFKENCYHMFNHLCVMFYMCDFPRWLFLYWVWIINICIFRVYIEQEAIKLQIFHLLKKWWKTVLHALHGGNTLTCNLFSWTICKQTEINIWQIRNKWSSTWTNCIDTKEIKYYWML